jgi:hypothetical protein
VPQGPEAADTPVEPDKSKVDKIDVSGTSSKEVAESAKTATKSAEAKLGKLSLGVKAETHENGDREFTAKIRVPELSKLKEGLSKFLGKGKKETPSSETKTESGKTEATQDTPKPGTEAQPDQKENVDTAAELGKNLNLSVDTIREFTNGGAPENVVNGVLEGMGALIANHDNFDEGQQAAANIVDAVNTFPLTIVGAEYKLSFDGSNFTVEMKTPAPKAAPDTKTDTQPTKPAEKPADQPLAKSDAKPADKPKAAEPKSADKKPTTPTNKPVTPRETPGKKVADAVRRSASGGGSLSDTLKNARPTPGNRAPDRGPALCFPE